MKNAKRPKAAQDYDNFTRHTDAEGMHTTCGTCSHKITVNAPKDHDGRSWMLFAKRRTVAGMLRHLKAAHGLD